MSRFCQSRIKAHRELDDDHRRTFNGLKHNVSYGVNMPQMHLLQQDRTDTNVSQLYVHYIQFNYQVSERVKFIMNLLVVHVHVYVIL